MNWNTKQLTCTAQEIWTESTELTCDWLQRTAAYFSSKRWCCLTPPSWICPSSMPSASEVSKQLSSVPSVESHQRHCTRIEAVNCIEIQNTPTGAWAESPQCGGWDGPFKWPAKASVENIESRVPRTSNENCEIHPSEESMTSAESCKPEIPQSILDKLQNSELEIRRRESDQSPNRLNPIDYATDQVSKIDLNISGPFQVSCECSLHKPSQLKNCTSKSQLLSIHILSKCCCPKPVVNEKFQNKSFRSQNFRGTSSGKRPSTTPPPPDQRRVPHRHIGQAQWCLRFTLRW